MPRGAMKLLGLIGGVSPESTQIYYRLLNDAAKARLGGEHSQRMIVSSFDFAVMADLYRRQDWDRYKAEVVEAGFRLKRAGADALMICSNTTGMAADALRQATDLPVVSLIDALAAALKAGGSEKPLLLGTPFTMEGDFYRPALLEQHGQETLIPDAEDRETVRRVIFDELVRGVVKDASRRAYLDIVERGRAAGADGVILGCTEICMLISQDDVDIPAFDTTRIHAEAASAYAFGEA